MFLWNLEKGKYCQKKKTTNTNAKYGQNNQVKSNTLKTVISE